MPAPRSLKHAPPSSGRGTARTKRGRAGLVAGVVVALLAAAAMTVPFGGRTLVSRWRAKAAAPEETGGGRTTAAEGARATTRPAPGARPNERTPEAKGPIEDIRAEDRAAVDALMR